MFWNTHISFSIVRLVSLRQYIQELRQSQAINAAIEILKDCLVGKVGKKR